MKKLLPLSLLFLVACATSINPNVSRDIANTRVKRSLTTKKANRFQSNVSNRDLKSSNVTTAEIVIDENSSKAELIQALKQRRSEINNWALVCDGEQAGQISEHVGECKQFDTNLYAGLGCLAAHLAGDEYTKEQRCRDVSLAQGENGRWWRGQSNINVTKKNSFSRDMMLGNLAYFLTQGVLSQDPQAKATAKDQAKRWIEWIEKEGDGKRMCNDDEGLDNRCSILRNRTMYHVFNKMGAIDSTNKNYKAIKRLKKKKGLHGWDLETKLVPPGYQVHLKSAELIQRYLLGVLNDDEYRKMAQIIYKKDELNPYYQFLLSGANYSLVDRTLKLCTSERTTQDQWTIWHVNSATFAISPFSENKPFEIAMGHDCIMLINYQIAVLENNFKLPFVEAGSSCGKREEIGVYDGRKVCKKKNFGFISKTKCAQKNGIEWDKEATKYCLLNKGKFFLAKNINKTCPFNHTEVGEWKGLPLCHREHLEKVPQYKCVGDQVGVSNHVEPTWTENHEWCYVNKTTWYQRRKLGRKCPVGYNHTGEFQWGAWPVCKGVASLRIKKEKCDESNYMIRKENHCWVQKNGWFNKRLYKGSCPAFMSDADKSKDDKPLCKPVPHLKIKKKKCDKKGGTQWDGWCIWSKDDYFKARKLK